MAAAPGWAPGLVQSSIRASWRLGRHVAGMPARGAREAVGLSRSTLRAVVPAGTDAGVDRQVWAAAGWAALEVRGLDGNGLDGAAVAEALVRAVAAVDGISWARLDPATSRLAIRYDMRRHTVADLVRVLDEAEQQALAGGDAADEVPALPEPSASGPHAAALVANAAGLGVALTTRLAGIPLLPPSAASLVALVEHQPWLRRRLDDALGTDGAELGLALLNPVVNGLTRNVPALVLDGAQRGLSLRADRERRSAAGRAAALRAPERPASLPTSGLPTSGLPTSGLPTSGSAERPVPLPPGPVERLASRAAQGSLLSAATLLAGTWNPDLAGRTVLVGVPRAAYAARQAFVDALTIGLSRREVLVVDPAAPRRLDRVTSVVVSSAVLHDDRSLILAARTDAEGWTQARVWRTAQRLLDGPRGTPAHRFALVRPPAPAEDDDRDGMPRGIRRLLTADGDTVGAVWIGRELDPLADAVLTAVREAGLRLVLTEDRSAAELGSQADEVLLDGHGDPAWLAAEIRRMQADGEVVALVGTDPGGLAAADVGIGLVPATGPVPETADLLAGPGLLEVPRIIAAIPAARGTSERGVRVSLGAAFLGALLLALGRAGSGGRAQLAVTTAALGALVAGMRAGSGVLRRPDPVPVPHTPWHAFEPEEVLARLPYPGPAEDEDEAGDGGRPAAAVTRAVRLLADLAHNVRAELDDPLTPVLATGAAASAVIGSATDSLLVGGVLAGSAVISGAQRMRADRALRELLMDQRLPARVVDGDHRTADDRSADDRTPLRGVAAAALRPGHLIDLQAGDVVPADARLLVARDLELDEATLTGESTPVGKETAATPGAELPDRTGMVYEGTTVIAGSGRAVVVAVGTATEAGRAMALAGRAAGPAGMQHRLEELTRRGIPVTLLGGAAVTALALLRGGSVRAAISSGVSVAVAAVPEGLPLMATVTQLGAARRLSRRGVLVRSSRTVEALGRVDTICFDKTGTLTEGRLRLVRAAGLDGEWPLEAPEARRVLREAAHAGPAPDDGRPLAHATDQAVLDAARQVLGGDLDVAWEELTEIPFHSDRGFSAVVGRTPSKVRLAVKGAPEVVLPRCTSVRDDRGKQPLGRDGQKRAAATVHALAGQGLRVLAVARRNVVDVLDELTGPDDVAALGDLTLLGFVGLADTPRPQAAPTVAALRSAGVATVMITGDHPVTARAIAAGLGIPVDELVIGPELAGLDESARMARVARASVCARVSPEQKLQIVEALQKNGRVVAMTGDGANDAAAIRLADVGIGMAAKGSTSARSAADLVFTQPDVSLVLDALVEGRAMWRRVRNAVAVLLGGNVGEVLFTLLGTAAAGHAPINTRQFLVVNMFTDLLPSMALALAPTPADPQERTALLAAGPPSLGGPLLRDIGLRGAVTAVGALAAWQAGRMTGTRVRAGTIALAALVGAEMGQTLLAGGRDPLVLATGLGSAAVLAAIIQTPVVSQFFGCTPLDPFAWAVVLTCTAGATVASAVLPGLLTRRGTDVPAPEGDAPQEALVPDTAPEYAGGVREPASAGTGGRP